MNKEGRCEKKKADRYMREGRRGRKKVQTREEQNKVEEKGKSLFLFFKLIKKKQRTTYKAEQEPFSSRPPAAGSAQLPIRQDIMSIRAVLPQPTVADSLLASKATYVRFSSN
jgi:hypothetical protein